MGRPQNGGTLALLAVFVLLPCAAASASARPPAVSPAAQPRPSLAPGSSLDPKQLTALQSMNLPTTRDPCTLPPPRNFTTCDSAAPFRRLLSLTLANCSSDLDISTTALRALATSLRSLSLLICPVPLVKLPPQLASSLRSFTCAACFRRLTGVWLSRLANLTELTVTDSAIIASGPSVILSQMYNLRALTISRTNLSGFLPHHWHSLNLTSVDLSGNHLRGPVHGSIGLLSSLEQLNLSSNSLSGILPDAIANMASLKNASFARNSLSGPIPEALAEMAALVHLDLSSNQFNGTVPRFLSELKGLRYLDLGRNNFHGVLPFNASFIKKLEVFRIGGNDNLCYNRTLLSSKLNLGIARCDKNGLPASPPPSRSAPADSSEYTDGADDVASGGGHHGPSSIVLGVAIGLSCLVFLIILIICMSRLCG